MPKASRCGFTYTIIVNRGIIITPEILAQPNRTTHTPPPYYRLLQLLDPGIETADLVGNIGNGRVEPSFELIKCVENDS